MKKFLQNSFMRGLYLIISTLFILGGVINTGWSGFFWAIPFLVLFVVLVRKYQLVYRVALASALTVVCISLAWQKQSNPLLYPYMHSQATFNSGWGFVQFFDSEHYHLIEPDQINSYFLTNENESEFYKKPLAIFKTPKTMKMVAMDISIADFGHRLLPVFEDDQGNRYSIFENVLVKGIKNGTISSNELFGINRFQSRWSEYLANLMYWPVFPILIKSNI